MDINGSRALVTCANRGSGRHFIGAGALALAGEESTQTVADLSAGPGTGRPELTA